MPLKIAYHHVMQCAARYVEILEIVQCNTILHKIVHYHIPWGSKHPKNLILVLGPKSLNI